MSEHLAVSAVSSVECFMIFKIDEQHPHILAEASVPRLWPPRGQVSPKGFCAVRGPTVEF